MTHDGLSQSDRKEHEGARACVSCRSDFASIADAMAQIAGFAEHAKLASEDAIKLQLVIEELMTNSIRHGQCDSDAEINIELLDRSTIVQINYTDEGTAFDPTSYAAPAPEAQSEAGYGWVLIRGMCRDIHYSRIDHINSTCMALPVARS